MLLRRRPALLLFVSLVVLLFGVWLLLAESPLLRPWEHLSDADLESYRKVLPETCGLVCTLDSTDRQTLMGAALTALGVVGLGFSGWAAVSKRRHITTPKAS
ncbi:hypothetical protein [Angustibacter luteus]|uniref:PDGLE domain-containing protein n=1 Tax=Angustibacter luteus TaxID=658456 RepID=A0ABW1JF71_9ACTN